jgi:hypothetical protein
MKIILLLISVVTLLSAGCIFPGPRGGGGEYRERGEYRDHEDYRREPGYRGPPEPGVDLRIHAP